MDKVKHLDKILENVLDTKIRHLEVKDRDTEHQIDMLSKKIEKTSDVNCFVEVKCKDCDKVCESKKSLRQHLMKNHPRSFSCAKCGKFLTPDSKWRNTLENMTILTNLNAG